MTAAAPPPPASLEPCSTSQSSGLIDPLPSHRVSAGIRRAQSGRLLSRHLQRRRPGAHCRHAQHPRHPPGRAAVDDARRRHPGRRAWGHRWPSPRRRGWQCAWWWLLARTGYGWPCQRSGACASPHGNARMVSAHAGDGATDMQAVATPPLRLLPPCSLPATSPLPPRSMPVWSANTPPPSLPDWNACAASSRTPSPTTAWLTSFATTRDRRCCTCTLSRGRC